MATEPEPQGPTTAVPPAPPAQGGRRPGRRGPGLPMGRIAAAAPVPPTQGLPTRTGESTPDWLEPAMAANGIGSFDWDIRRDLVEGDQRACTILGLSGSGSGFDRTSAGFLALLHPEDAPVVRRRIERAVAELGQCGAYYRTLLPGGELHAVRFRGRVLADAFGRPSRMVGFVWDATAELHKRADAGRQAALREERSRFIKEAARALSEAVTVRDVARVFTELPLPGLPPDGLVLAALETGRLKILGASGYRQEDMTGFDRTPINPHHPAAEAIRNRVPVFLASRAEYQERYPLAWPRAAETGRGAWVFLPLVASGRASGVCVVSFDDSRRWTPTSARCSPPSAAWSPSRWPGPGCTTPSTRWRPACSG